MFRMIFLICALVFTGCSSSKKNVVGTASFDVPEKALSGPVFTLPKTLTGACNTVNRNVPASNITKGVLTINSEQTGNSLLMKFSCSSDSLLNSITVVGTINGNDFLNFARDKIGKVGSSGMTVLTPGEEGVVYEIRMLITDIVKLQITGALNGSAIFELKGTSEALKSEVQKSSETSNP